MKNPLELIEESKLIQIEINKLQKSRNKLGVEYQNLVNEIMVDELDTVFQATKEVYGDVATVKKLDGFIKIRFKKTENYTRYLGDVKRSIEKELNTESMIIVEGIEVNNYNEYKVIYVKFGKGYIKRTKKLPTWN